jgi:hypothetical protein
MQSTRNRITGVIGAAFFLILGALLTSAVQPPASTAPARHYYLTKSTFTGAQALNKCASGYHFASFVELMDLSVLTYNSNLGRTAPDAGSGPPSSTLGAGWVRSGYSANTSGGTNFTPTNCNLWTSSSSSDSGTVVVPVPFTTQSASGAMEFLALACDGSQASAGVGVWCVQN